MPDIPDDVGLVTLHNGGADYDGCCICCGTTRGWTWGLGGVAGGFGNQKIQAPGTSNHIEGDTCYCGCCACYPAGSLKFSILAGKHVSKGQEERPLDNPDGWEFTLAQGDTVCKEHAQQNVEHQAFFPGWFCSSSATQDFCGPYTDNINFGTDPAPIFCADARQKRGYPESWGYTGKICADTYTTPDCPGYSYPESCGGMAIKASLCCCKNAMTNKWGTKDNERDFGADAECPPRPLYDTRPGGAGRAIYQYCASDHIWFRDHKNEDCMLDCFTFTISPDEAYTHTYERAVEDPDRHGHWKLESAEKKSSCSQCVYEQGECIHNNNWDPSSMYVGTEMQGNWVHGVGDNASASVLGQMTIISGTCQSNFNNQKFAMMVVGAFTMDCDCSTGTVEKRFESSACENCIDPDPPLPPPPVCGDEDCTFVNALANCGGEPYQDPVEDGICYYVWDFAAGAWSLQGVLGNTCSEEKDEDGNFFCVCPDPPAEHVMMGVLELSCVANAAATESESWILQNDNCDDEDDDCECPDPSDHAVAGGVLTLSCVLDGDAAAACDDPCQYEDESPEGWDEDIKQWVDLDPECVNCNPGMHIHPDHKVLATLPWDDTPFWPDWVWDKCNSSLTDGDWHYNDNDCNTRQDCRPPEDHPEWCGDIKCNTCDGECANPCVRRTLSAVYFTGIIEEA